MEMSARETGGRKRQRGGGRDRGGETEETEGGRRRRGGETSVKLRDGIGVMAIVNLLISLNANHSECGDGSCGGV